jgi:hypothetical protein
MLNKITLEGVLLDENSNGILIGGKPFRYNAVQKTDVTEDVFLNLCIAEENKWFRILFHNYEEFLNSRGRELPKLEKIEASIELDDDKSDNQEPPVNNETPIDETPIDETPIDETPIDETPIVIEPVIEPVIEKVEEKTEEVVEEKKPVKRNTRRKKVEIEEKEGE